MRHRIHIASVFLCLTALFSRPLSAWPPQELGVGVQAGIPLLMQGYGPGIIIEGPLAGDLFSNPGMAGGLHMRMPVLDLPRGVLEATGDAGYYRAEYSGVGDINDTSAAGEILTGPMHTNLMYGTLLATYNPFPDLRVQPLVSLGLGLTYYFVGTGYPASLEEMKAEGVSPHACIGLGARTVIKDRWTAFANLRYNAVITPHDIFPAPPARDQSLMNAVVAFKVGVEYMFHLRRGNDRDADGVPDGRDECPELPEDRDGTADDDGCPDPDHDDDLIPDAADKCPAEPEDIDGHEDEDGCPDEDNDGDGVPDIRDYCPGTPAGSAVDVRGCPSRSGAAPRRPAPARTAADTDNDGIPDSDDKCAALAEDMDGFEDADGCPDLDNDQDGKLDKDDECPTEPEDVDGFSDKDGCPDPDNDGDGIADADDKCPGSSFGDFDSKETYNGFKDDDGCPDEKPAEIKRGKMVLEGVTFQKGSAALTESSYGKLDKVFESLQAYPEITVEIRGYTDSKGKYEFNRKLSQRRAESVKQYLVNMGIKSSRLKAKGYGPADPIASNDTASGRARNRRIEFHRTD